MVDQLQRHVGKDISQSDKSKTSIKDWRAIKDLCQQYIYMDWGSDNKYSCFS